MDDSKLTSEIDATFDTKARLRRLTTPDIVDALQALGVTRVVMQDVRPMTNIAGPQVGRARTLRLLPDREDVKSAPRGPVNRSLYDTIGEGEMLVVDAMANTRKAALGDMMFERLAARQVAGVVVSGAVRDVPAVAALSLPVFAMASCPQAYMGHMRAWEADCDVSCGGVLVRPGDWVVADEEGVVVIPDSHIAQVLETAEAKQQSDQFSRALLRAGHVLDVAYPLPVHMRQYLLDFLQTGKVPSASQLRLVRAQQS